MEGFHATITPTICLQRVESQLDTQLYSDHDRAVNSKPPGVFLEAHALLCAFSTAWGSYAAPPPPPSKSDKYEI